jgi:coatomer protein complex subunit gamma
LTSAGSEGSVDKLLKQIGGFMSDIADDFKVVVVEAIRALALKFPAKHRALMNFLSSVLREEGGFDYKKAIVGAILALIQVGPSLEEYVGW